MQLKKYGNNQVAIFDEKNKRFVRSRGENLAVAVKNIRRLDLREYFQSLKRQEIIKAVQIIYEEQNKSF